MLDQILLSQSDKIEVDIKYNGVLTNPTSISIKTLTDPSGSVLASDITVTAGATTGRYYYTVPVSYTGTLGIYTALWEFTIEGTVFQHSQQFEVVSSIRGGYIVPQQVRDQSTYSEITATSPTDAVLQRYIDQAAIITNNYVGSDLNYSTYTDTVRCIRDLRTGGVMIPLNHAPIVSLTSVSLTTYPTSTVTLTAGNFRVTEDLGILEYMYNVAYPTLQACAFDPLESDIIPEATVTYTAGYTSIPDDLVMANVMLVESLYKEDNGDGQDMTKFTLFEQSEYYGDSKSKEESKSKLGITRESLIRNILNRYKQPGNGPAIFGPQ